jgi:cell volume regulation protein A
VLVGLPASWLLDLSTLEGLLIGSIVSATDSAAIFSVLRGSSIERRLARILEGESGFNDPVAILLVIGFIDWIQEPGYGLLDMVALGISELTIGAAAGFVVGRLGTLAFRRMELATPGLYPVASIAVAALAYGTADVLQGSGFLAVYLAALELGSANVPARRTITEFHSGIAWVSQIVVFFTLGLLVFPSDFGAILGDALLITAVLIFVARPVAAIVATRIGAIPLRQALLLGWAGLKGAIPIVLATFAVIEDVPGAMSYLNIVFFVVLVSALLQGATFEPIARFLGVTTDAPALPRPLLEVGRIRRLGAEVLEFPVGEDDAAVGRLINELGLPRDALVNVIVRADQALLPRGSTEIEAGDRLHILVRRPVRDLVESLFELWREGPIGPGKEELPPPVQGRTPIFSVRPWREEFGDAGNPEAVEDVPVVRQVRTRRGAPGALVVLEDGRFAVTGDVVATGGARQLFRYVRNRIRRSEAGEERSWWQEVAGVLSQRGML